MKSIAGPGLAIVLLLTTAPAVRAQITTGSVAGTVTIEVGGTTELLEVKGEAPQIQASSGERSFTIDTESVASLPVANRSFSALAALTPGVVINSSNNLPTRLGGGGESNFMMD